MKFERPPTDLQLQREALAAFFSEGTLEATAARLGVTKEGARQRIQRSVANGLVTQDELNAFRARRTALNRFSRHAPRAPRFRDHLADFYNLCLRLGYVPTTTELQARYKAIHDGMSRKYGSVASLRLKAWEDTGMPLAPYKPTRRVPG